MKAQHPNKISISAKILIGTVLLGVVAVAILYYVYVGRFRWMLFHENIPVWTDGQMTYSQIYGEKPAYLVECLTHKKAQVRFAAACAIVNQEYHYQYNEDGHYSAIRRNVFDDKVIGIAFEELKQGYAAQDPDYLGLRRYVAEHLHRINDKRMIEIMVLANLDPHVAAGSSGCGVYGELSWLTNDFEDFPENYDVWPEWVHENLDRFKWNGEYFDLKE